MNNKFFGDSQKSWTPLNVHSQIQNLNNYKSNRDTYGKKPKNSKNSNNSNQNLLTIDTETGWTPAQAPVPLQDINDLIMHHKNHSNYQNHKRSRYDHALQQNMKNYSSSNSNADPYNNTYQSNHNPNLISSYQPLAHNNKNKYDNRAYHYAQQYSNPDPEEKYRHKMRKDHNRKREYQERDHNDIYGYHQSFSNHQNNSRNDFYRKNNSQSYRSSSVSPVQTGYRPNPNRSTSRNSSGKNSSNHSHNSISPPIIRKLTKTEEMNRMLLDAGNGNPIAVSNDDSKNNSKAKFKIRSSSGNASTSKEHRQNHAGRKSKSPKHLQVKDFDDEEGGGGERIDEPSLYDDSKMDMFG